MMSNYRHLLHVVPDPGGAWVLAPGGTARLDSPRKPVHAWSESDWKTVEDLGLMDPVFGEWYGVTLFVTTACNLRCSYCFQNQSGVSGKRIPVKRLSSRELDWAVETAARQAEVAGAKRLALTLMGGEPLVAKNVCFEALKVFCQRFSVMDAELVTNGTLLRVEELPRWESLGLHGLQLTLDGGKRAHDAVRVSRAKPRTFDAICSIIKAVLDRTALRVVLRLNVSPELLIEGPAMLSEIEAAVPLAHPSLTMDIAPVVGVDWSSRFADEAVQDQLWEALLTRATELGTTIPVPQASACLHCADPEGARGLVIGPGGLLYQNWAEAGREELAVGRATPSGAKWTSGGRWRSCAAPATGISAPQHSVAGTDSYWRAALRQAYGR